MLDVQDENSGDHPSGQYTFTVSDDRFEVADDEGEMLRPSDDAVDNDRMSAVVLRVKEGAMFDYEVDFDVDVFGAPILGQYTITVTATQVDGSHSITQATTLTIADDPSDDDSPGLDDDDRDTDHDGPPPPGRLPPPEEDDMGFVGGDGTVPPSGSSVGIIEGVAESMDGFEQDLFEDFMLVTDDGLDIV